MGHWHMYRDVLKKNGPRIERLHAYEQGKKMDLRARKEV